MVLTTAIKACVPISVREVVEDLVFTNVRLGVHDITYLDVETQTQRTLDGVFGSNFLCASAKMEGLLPGDISQTVIEKVVIDMPGGTLGLRFDPRLSR